MASTTPDQPPNIVVIFTDDQGYGDVGCFGSPHIHTPHLDQMATEGLKLTNFYVGASICTPSRAALMTGQDPRRAGWEEGVLKPSDPEGLHPSHETIASVLSDAGYATGCFGKWHLGDHEPFLPTNHGFDTYLGIPYSNDMGAAQHDGEYRELPLMRDTETIEAPVDQSTLTRRYTEAAIDFIDDHQDEPFFCYVPQTMPHVPLARSEAFAGQSKRGTYGDVIEEIDWSVGQILDAIDQRGLGENTLVLFTSDNGPWLSKGIDGGSSGPLRGGKMSGWEGGQRVPAICRWPGTIPAQEVCSTMVTAMDLLPTCANLAGVDDPDPPLDGYDIFEILTAPEETETPHERMFYYSWPGREAKAIRDGEGWKYHFEAEELFYLPEDVEERHDLSEDHPEKVRDLKALRDSYKADIMESRLPFGTDEEFGIE